MSEHNELNTGDTKKKSSGCFLYTAVMVLAAVLFVGMVRNIKERRAEHERIMDETEKAMQMQDWEIDAQRRRSGIRPIEERLRELEP